MRLYVLGATAILGLLVAPARAADPAQTPVAAAAAQASAAAVATPAATPSPQSKAVPLSGSAKVQTQSSSLSPTAKPAPAKDAAGNSPAAFQAPHRIPAVATGLAFIPGVAIHGAGHMYAGSWLKGVGLFLLEGASVYLGYDAYRNHLGDYNRVANAFSNKPFQLPTNMGGAEQETGVLLVAGTGFIYGWLDDIVGAPIAANEFNKLHAQDTPFSLGIQPRPDGVLLALTRNF
jgi:hypothetical protein